MRLANPTRLWAAAALVVVAIWISRPGTSRDFGYEPNPAGTREFLKELEEPYFATAGKECLDKFERKPVLLYRAGYRVHEEIYGAQWKPLRQTIGDCVSHGWALSCWLSMCQDYLDGKIADPPPLVSTESVYGGSKTEARGRTTGSWSDGSYGGAAAKWVRDWGVTFRLQYPAEDGGHNLLEYQGNLAKNWGFYGNGGQNDNGVFDKVAKRHPMRHVALVKTFEEAAAAINSGYPVAVCSGAGFSSRRDEQGFSPRQGGWAHCMAFVATRFDRPGLLCQNSWGSSWNSGPRWPDDQPDGSFWVDATTVTQMLSGGDSFCVGGVEGFQFRELDHGEWLTPVPGVGDNE